MLDPHPHDEGAALRVAISASLGLMIVDFLWLIRDEVKFVWSRLSMSWYARIYMLTRYVGLASQIYNVYFTVRMYLGVHTSPYGCRFWFAYQAVVVQFLLLFVEGLLMHRLYALFLRSRLILLIMILFVIFQIASMVGNPGNALFSATTMTTNVIIFFMTFWRYLRLPPKWTRDGLGRIVMRDSALSLSAISVMMLFLTLCSLQVIKPKMSGNITYYWLVCILWVSIGRIIVNHEKIPREEGERKESNTWKGTLQLTSQIEMGQSVWSVDTQHGSSDGQTPASRTLQSSFSTPITKASQLSPTGSCPSDSSRKWPMDCSPSFEHGHEHSPQLSSAEVSAEMSTRQLSPSSVSASGDVPQTTDHLQADAVADALVQRPRSSLGPQPSGSELPPLEVPP